MKKLIEMSNARNSSFKVRAEAVDTHYGIPPRPGAIMFLRSDHKLIYGDGYNWLDLGPGDDQKAAIALAVLNPFQIDFAAGVEQQCSFYDNVIYEYQDKFVPGPDQLTILGHFGIDMWCEYTLQADCPGTVVTIMARYNGFDSEEVVKLETKDLPQIVQSYAQFTADPAERWKVFAKTDRNCKITVRDVKLGFHERTGP